MVSDAAAYRSRLAIVVGEGSAPGFPTGGLRFESAGKPVFGSSRKRDLPEAVAIFPELLLWRAKGRVVPFDLIAGRAVKLPIVIVDT